AEPADAPLAGRDVRHDRGTPSDAVSVPIERILERQDRVVRDRFHETRAEHGDWRAVGDDGRLLRDHGLAAMLRGREEMHQRVASRAEPLELARVVAIRGASFDDDAYAADRGHAVTRGAARRVECRPKTLLGRLDFGEILQPEPELGELG